MPKVLSAALLLSGLSVGCADSSSGAPSTEAGTQGAVLTPEDHETQLTADLCRAAFHCGSGTGEAVRLVFPSETECRARAGGATARGFADLNRLVRSGAVGFDLTAARNCLALRATLCDPSALDAACRGVFRGNVAVGGVCYRNEECAADGWCDLGAAPTCPGVCRPPTALGGACAASSECGTAGVAGISLCNPTPGPTQGHCIDFRVAPATLGQPCGGVVGTTNVEVIAQCPPDLACTLAGSGRTCRVPTALGGTCGPDDHCVPGTRCVTSDPRRPGICQSLVVQSHSGDPCDVSGGPPGGPRSCNPAQHLQCVGGTCMAMGTGAAGTPCSGPFGFLACDPGLACLSGGCQVLLSDGAACQDGVHCASGVCSGSPATCQARSCG